MKSLRKAHDDRNYFHAMNFHGYSSITGEKFKRGIELGCGPFTNMRIIRKIAHFREIHLLDPLLKYYLLHPNCKYQNQQMAGQAVILHPCLIEQFSTHLKFDCVILINVLEHCMDVNLVFLKILDILDSGGKLIFHDRYYDRSNDISVEDTLHPIKIFSSTIIRFLQENFKTIFIKRVRMNYSSSEIYNQESIYFIGEKLPLTTPHL